MVLWDIENDNPLTNGFPNFPDWIGFTRDPRTVFGRPWGPETCSSVLGTPTEYFQAAACWHMQYLIGLISVSYAHFHWSLPNSIPFLIGSLTPIKYLLWLGDIRTCHGRGRFKLVFVRRSLTWSTVLQWQKIVIGSFLNSLTISNSSVIFPFLMTHHHLRWVTLPSSENES